MYIYISLAQVKFDQEVVVVVEEMAGETRTGSGGSTRKKEVLKGDGRTASAGSESESKANALPQIGEVKRREENRAEQNIEKALRMPPGSPPHKKYA